MSKNRKNRMDMPHQVSVMAGLNKDALTSFVKELLKVKGGGIQKKFLDNVVKLNGCEFATYLEDELKRRSESGSAFEGSWEKLPEAVSSPNVLGRKLSVMHMDKFPVVDAFDNLRCLERKI